MKNCSYYNHRDKCGCGIDLAIIPASVGDDSKNSPAAPRNGQYQDTVVKYEASGNTYIYAHDGTYSKTTTGASVLSVNGLTGEVVLDAAAVGALPDTTVIPTKTSELINDSNFVNRASLANVSFTGLYDDLIGYPTALSQFNNDTNFATTSDVSSAVGDEATARENADINLQSQIDAITVSSDVTDVVGTKAALNNYDTSKLRDNDIIKVLQDESQNGETTYYRWSAQSEAFTLIGEEGPYYTKSETDTLLSTKQNSLAAGTGIDITGSSISVDTSAIQPKLTAGNNIAISNNVISATDTTYSAFTGTDGTAAGTSGLVPAPATTDAGKFLKADGTWDTAGGGGPTVVQNVGTSTTDVMSQNAVTSIIYSQADSSDRRGVKIGTGSASSGSYWFNTVVGPNAKVQNMSDGGIAIGGGAVVMANGAICIGFNNAVRGAYSTAVDGNVGSQGSYGLSLGKSASCNNTYSVSLGAASITGRNYEVSVGSGSGNNPTRYIANVTDPAQAQDAATKNYVDTAVASAGATPLSNTQYNNLWSNA